MRHIQAIQSAVWAIRPWEALSNYHLAMRVVNGDYMTAVDKVEKPQAYTLHARTKTSTTGQTSASQVAMYELNGVVTKADQYCGPSGTVTLMRSMRQADRDPNVAGHFLSIDSGGGEATNIEEVARMIRGLSKPVVAHFNGLCCSAAYGIASGATEIYATLDTDICGSIGVMMTFADWRQYFEDKGIKIHEVYADQSSLKNDIFMQALDGNYDPIKTELLNPFADNFIALIQEMRPATTGHSDIFQGKTYMSKNALDKGLIDGMKSQNDAVNRVFELADERTQKQNISPSQKNATMAFEIFGIKFGAKNEDGSMNISAEQFAQLEAAAKDNSGNTATAEAITALTETVKALNTKIEAIDGKVNVIEGKLEVLPATAVAKPNGEVQAEKTELTAKQKANLMIANSMK
jgi:protease-4